MEFAIFDELSTVEGEEQAQTYEEHLQMVVLAEQLGFHSYWFAEHHFGTDRAAPSPNLMIAAASQLTSQILLGNMINVLPFHHPVRLAEETAMLDHLTNGRVQFGIGRGVRPPEFRRYMVDMNLSREMFTESFDMHRQLWTTPGASARGTYWSYEDVTIVPSVLQKPYPPVWCTGMSVESVRWAAEQGLPYATSFLSTEETRALGEEYREAFRPSERWPVPCFVVMRHLYLSDSMSSARAEVGHVYNRLFHAWLDVALTSHTGVPESYKALPERHVRLGNMNLDQLLEEGLVLFGGRDEVSEGVAQHRELGADLLLLWVSPWGVPVERAAASLERFAHEVMPEFKAVAGEHVGESAG